MSCVSACSESLERCDFFFSCKHRPSFAGWQTCTFTDMIQRKKKRKKKSVFSKRVTWARALRWVTAWLLPSFCLICVFCFLQQCGIKNTQQSHGGSNAAIWESLEILMLVWRLRKKTLCREFCASSVFIMKWKGSVFPALLWDDTRILIVAAPQWHSLALFSNKQKTSLFFPCTLLSSVLPLTYDAEHLPAPRQSCCVAIKVKLRSSSTATLLFIFFWFSWKQLLCRGFQLLLLAGTGCFCCWLLLLNLQCGAWWGQTFSFVI